MDNFKVIVADPPWPYRDRLTGNAGAVSRYILDSLEDIKNYELPPLQDDAWLFLWRPAQFGKEVYEVLEAWGFRFKAELIWLKRTKTGKLFYGEGRTLRVCHEVCIVASRGKPYFLDKRGNLARSTNAYIRTVLDGFYTGHSIKPDEFYNLVETFSDGPYLDFSSTRQPPRPNWYAKQMKTLKLPEKVHVRGQDL